MAAEKEVFDIVTTGGENDLEIVTRIARSMVGRWGMSDRIGTLSRGKRADMVAVSFAAPELAPCYDPLSHLAYAMGREHVSHVWVDGRLLVENGALTGLDAHRLSAMATRWKERVRAVGL